MYFIEVLFAGLTQGDLSQGALPFYVSDGELTIGVDDKLRGVFTIDQECEVGVRSVGLE